MFNSSWISWKILMSSAIPAVFITIFSATVDFGLDSKIFHSFLAYRLLNFVWVWNEVKHWFWLKIPKYSIGGVWSSNGRAHFIELQCKRYVKACDVCINIAQWKCVFYFIFSSSTVCAVIKFSFPFHVYTLRFSC